MSFSLRHFGTLLLFLHIYCAVEAQYERKLMNAVRVSEAPKINGRLDENCWKSAPIANDFVIISPHPGELLREKTEVRIVYDDEAIYIGFINYDSAPDSILSQLAGRDLDGNNDYCGIIFGCYQDGINGFSFYASATGEQRDARLTASKDEDLSWNAIWYCETNITDEGWVAEFKIPFAALRFPSKQEQQWHINFTREIRRTRHKSYWNGVNPLVPGLLTQMGFLNGINGIKPPRRIFLFPYTSTYYRINENADKSVSKGFSYNGGMDIKLGLSDAFTLDATLIPDFGQTISDQQILNLSAFDLQFAENRQFFLEGTELFSKVNIFYSRRIGFERPLGYNDVASQLTSSEKIIENPQRDKVINAIKVSGRNKNGLGIGFLNAVTAPSNAIVRDMETGVERSIQSSSLTNYNVIVLDQNLPNNSYVTFINTAVLRNGRDYDATVTGGQFQIRNKGNSYFIAGSGAYNQKHGLSSELIKTNQHKGFKQELYGGKINGNFNYSAGYSLKSRYFDPNDLGFQAAPNAAVYWAQLKYNIYKPFGRYNNLWSTFNFNHRNLYEPGKFTDILVSGNLGLTTKKFLSYNFQFESSPIRGYDYFEPRVEGRVFRTYVNHMYGGWISTDYRDKLAWDFSVFHTVYENTGRYKFNWRIAPRWRLNDHLFITYVYSKQTHFGDLGFAFAYENGDNSKPLFAKRDVISHTNVLSVKYAFNPEMTINTRVRHYWGYSKYNKFYSLKEDGYLIDSDQTASDFSFNSFTVDLIYSWIFKPASELSIVWQQAINDNDTMIPASFGDDLNYTFNLPQSNTFSMRFIYFIDYRSLVGARNRNSTSN